MEGLHNIDKNIFDILTNQGSHDDCIFNLVQSDEIFKQKLLYKGIYIECLFIIKR